LSEQEPALWSRPMMEEAERELSAAARQARPGRFQLEAAIQSVHAERARTGRTDWRALAGFYEHLVRPAPTPRPRVGGGAPRCRGVWARGGARPARRDRAHGRLRLSALLGGARPSSGAPGRQTPGARCLRPGDRPDGGRRGAAVLARAARVMLRWGAPGDGLFFSSTMS